MSQALLWKRDIASGAAIAALGAWLSVEATTIPPGPSHALIGPAVFPYAVGGGLIFCGVVILAKALIQARRTAGHAAAPEVHLPAFLLITGVLLAYVLLYQPLGFLLASVLAIPAAARVFGSRRPARDVLVAAAVSGVVYIVFSYLIGLEVPKGWIFRWLGSMVG